MACLVKRKKGKITSVKTEDGKESKLFRAIHSNPFLAGTETSLEVYKNVYSEEIQKDFEGATENVYDTGEPMLYIQGKDGVYDNIEEAIIANETGDLQAAFKNPKTGKMIPVLSFKTHGNPRGEFIYSMIGQGFLSPNRVLDKDGNTTFEGKGKNYIEKQLGAHATKFEAYINGNARVTTTLDGKVTIPNNDLVSRVEMADGSVKYVRTEDVLKEIKENDPVNKLDLLYDYYTLVDSVIPIETKDVPTNKESIEDLRGSLNNFLKLMGFNTSTLEAYSERYNAIHGRDPDVQALTDMANKVVAFREGKIGIEDLSEEVAHIAIEFYSDQESIASALAVVHLTEEYAEYAEYYRSKYAAQHKDNPVALEEAVRKEVLGKILKNELTSRFSEENKTPERISLINQLKEIWSSFVEFLATSVNRRHVDEIARINEKIANSVLNGTIGDFQAEVDTNNVFYSATSKSSKVITSKLKIAKGYLEDLYYKELGTSVPNKVTLDRIADEMSEIDIINSANTLAGLAAQQSEVLMRSLRASQKDGVPISREDEYRYVFLESTRTELESILKELNAMEWESADSAIVKKAVEDIAESISTTSKRFGEAKPIIDENSEVVADKIIEKSLEHTELGEDAKAKIMEKYNADQKDISSVGYLFQLMSSSKHVILSTLPKLFKDMRTTVNKAFLNVANPFLKEVQEKGLEKYQRGIVKRVGGKATHYHRGPVNLALYEEEKRKKEIELILEIDPSLSEEKVIEKLKSERAITFFKDTEKQQEFNRRIKEWQKQEQESRNTESYEKEKLERFDRAFVSEVTQEVISNKNSAIRQRNLKYQDSQGRVDSSKKSESDKLQDQIDRNNYRDILSAYVGGEVREGLRIIDASEISQEERERLSRVLPFEVDSEYRGEIVVPEGTINSKEDYKRLADALEDTDSRVSLDLNTLNMTYRQELKTGAKRGGFSSEFFERLKEEIERGGKAFEWATDNGTLTFTSEYFEALTGENFVGYVDAAERMLADMSDSAEKRDLQVTFSELKTAMAKKKNLSKKYRKDGRPMETDVTSMTDSDMRAIIALDTEIEMLKHLLSVPQDYFETEDGIEMSEQVLTSDFYNGVETSGLTEYEFAMMHMTESKKRDVIDFSVAMSRQQKGISVKIKKSHSAFIDRVSASGKLKGKTRDEALQILKDEYAKSKVASYYQRFEPKGATKFLNSLKGDFGKQKDSNGETNLEKFLKRDEQFLEENPLAKFIEITPDHTWSEDIGGEKNRNKRYMNNEYYVQPRLTNPDGTPSKYVDKEYFDRYGIDMAKWLANPNLDLSQHQATKNKEEHRFLQMVVDLKEKTLAEYGQSQQVSKFQRAQMSKSTAEIITGVGRGGTRAAAQDRWKRLWGYRVDDKDAGEMVDPGAKGEQLNIRTIPTYYLDRLEDPEMLTENTLEAELLMHKEAVQYKAKRAMESDVNALLRKIENENHKTTGVGGKVLKISKGGQGSNLYKKASEYVGANLYGIQQTRNLQTSVMGRDVNLTKVISLIQSFTRFGNLAYNFMVDITSFTTGQTVNWADRFAGDYYHRSSFDRALTTAPKIFKYISESGSLHKQSELNHLLELFMVEKIDDRLSNSAQGRGIKLLDRSAFGISKVSNMGIKPQILFSNIMDVRFIDGKFQGWEQYYNAQKIKDKSKSKKVIEAEFKAQSRESLYDHLDIRKDGISFNEKFSEKFENPEAEFGEIVKRMSSKIENMVQITDTVISESDRLAAQRDIFTNQFMMHKGWLPIQLTKRFKAEHINFATGRIEQGQYVFIADIAKSLMKARSMEAITEAFRELDTHQRANAKRVAFELGISMGMFLLAQFIFAADDDDDSYLEDVLQYSFLRTSREFHASTLPGTFKSVLETIKSPVTAINTLEGLEPFTLMTNMFGLVTGDWEPMWKTTKSLTVAKRYGQLTDIQKQINSYWHFNGSTIPFSHPIKEERRRIAKEKKEMRENRKKEREAALNMQVR